LIAFVRIKILGKPSGKAERSELFNLQNYDHSIIL